MMKYLLLACAGLAAHLTQAQTENWAVSLISPAMTLNADAVLRLDELNYTVRSPTDAVLRVRQVITILNEKADGKAQLVVPYDKFSKVTDIEGAIFDASGKQVKRLKQAEITDLAYAQDNYADDSRYKVAQFSRQLAYPYTVEFRYEVSSRNLMFYPTWQPQDDERLSVIHSRFIVDVPAMMPLRYKEANLTRTLTKQASTEVKDGFAYAWQVDTLPAIEQEPLAPMLAERVPTVYTAPNQFTVQDYIGSCATWKDVGDFYYVLNKGRDALPDAVRRQVQELVAGEKTVAGKVQKIYDQLQKQARYISIQLGIGGWQTIEASRVAQTHYGDCKALTNYTKAMLGVVGIPAYEALVKAGESAPDIRTDLPGFQFNHVFLCVPNNRDTLWLECTSQLSPVGYLGNFTGNRHVLLITPEGGKLVRTPAYTPDNNRQRRSATVVLTPEGAATVHVQSVYTGLQQEPYIDVIHGLTHDQQRDWLIKSTNLPSFELTGFGFAETKATIPAITETITLSTRRWASPSGSRLFLPLNLLSATSLAPVLTKPRQSPVVLKYTYDFEDTDTIRYTLPDGFAPEYALAPLSLDTKFGTYQARADVQGNQLIYTRRLRMHRGRYPAEAYADYADFRKKVARADKAQLVLIKKEVAAVAPK
ncbi:DUF3857 and transglutaminase domain-containing protein [Fibrella sp. HMF5335]|uniref:DUF3857 and transglutaminase domain-containing protein n=1 Tax=Fibrella rubiginis TaxID=2817060 RepID=A0A939GNU4_9BACT|nr:DUF3857 domain-containing protein [Fibrella rubiginis]MBO0939887.1 DUF3857 and transglutaminase domain-containing protein [Fibrella rubiginis]